MQSKRWKYEVKFEQDFCKILEANGWFVSSRTSSRTSGFPDRVIIKGGCVIFIEFKLDKTKQLTPVQQQTRHAIEFNGGIYMRICQDNRKDMYKKILEIERENNNPYKF